MAGSQIDFDWDPSKARSNLAKHGVAFDDALTIFGDPLALTVFDLDNSDQEERWITIGQARTGRLLVVVHTHDDRNEQAITVRIISARAATKREAVQYREGLSP